jgi:AcrR family transcriptional regulator
MAAMVEVTCEQGFHRASVSSVCARARVSGRVFYECFPSREECFLAVLDDGHDRVAALIFREFGATDCRLDALRATLGAILDFLDRESGLARLCLVESLAAGRWALERRERHVTSVRRLILAHGNLLDPEEAFPLASEASVASGLGLVQRHLLEGRPQPLVGLLGTLMAQATAPYLSPEGVEAELRRSESLAGELAARGGETRPPSPHQADAELPQLLRDPRTHRRRACVRFLASNPGANNRQIARAVGITSDTQISTTLARLASADLLYKRYSKAGGPNAWMLTAHGTVVARLLDSCSLQPSGLPGDTV